MYTDTDTSLYNVYYVEVVGAAVVVLDVVAVGVVVLDVVCAAIVLLEGVGVVLPTTTLNQPSE